MKIVLVNDSRGRDERRTVDMLHAMGVPYGRAKLPVTVRVTRGDQSVEWSGYQPHMIRRHTPLAVAK